MSTLRVNTPTVTVKGVRGILAYADTKGVDVSRVLRRAAVPRASIDDPDGRVTREQMVRLWRELEVALDDPAVALNVSRSLPFGAYDVMDYAFATSANVGEGVETLMRYFRLFVDRANFGIERQASVGVCSYGLLDDEHGLERYSAELVMAALVDRIRLCATLQVWRPVEVRFAHASAADLRVYESFFDSPVRFGAGANQLVLPLTVLDASMKRADSGLNAVLRRHAEGLLERLVPVTSFDEAVRHELIRAISDGRAAIAVAETAQRMGVSPRTLQRRLRESGTTYNDVLEGARREMATKFLADPSIAISEMAFLLGFSEPSAFTRAFRRWTGQTPGATRKRLLQATDASDVE